MNCPDELAKIIPNPFIILWLSGYETVSVPPSEILCRRTLGRTRFPLESSGFTVPVHFRQLTRIQIPGPRSPADPGGKTKSSIRTCRET